MCGEGLTEECFVCDICEACADRYGECGVLGHAEFAVRVPTQVVRSAAVPTLHNSKVVDMDAKNDLFSLSV